MAKFWFRLSLLFFALAVVSPLVGLLIAKLSRQGSQQPVLTEGGAQPQPEQTGDSVRPRPQTPPEPMKLKVGDRAPDFTLLAYDGAKLTGVSLHDFRGKKNVALAFYIFAFTGG